MTTEKPWYFSRTIWASLITVATAVAGLAGIPIGDADSVALTDTLLQAITAIAGIVAILGRVSARDRIG
jgi:hypothetical protein